MLKHYSVIHLMKLIFFYNTKGDRSQEFYYVLQSFPLPGWGRLQYCGLHAPHSILSVPMSNSCSFLLMLCYYFVVVFFCFRNRKVTQKRATKNFWGKMRHYDQQIENCTNCWKRRFCKRELLTVRSKEDFLYCLYEWIWLAYTCKCNVFWWWCLLCRKL